MRKGNLVEAILSGEVDMMMHVTNCQNTMGSGIAKEVKAKIPEAFEAYTHSLQELGTFSKSKQVINLHAQMYYGADGKRYLNYGALALSVYESFELISEEGFVGTLGIPYLMGSDRAGGDWVIVLEILTTLARRFNIELVVYKLN